MLRPESRPGLKFDDMLLEEVDGLGPGHDFGAELNEKIQLLSLKLLELLFNRDFERQ